MTEEIKPVPDELLDQLRSKMEFYPHFSNSLLQGLSEEERMAKYAELKHPYLWQVAEVSGDDKVLVDVGRGQLAYFRKDVFIAHFKQSFIGKDLVILCRDFYGTDKYIWR